MLIAENKDGKDEMLERNEHYAHLAGLGDRLAALDRVEL